MLKVGTNSHNSHKKRAKGSQFFLILGVNPFKFRELEVRANEAEAALEELKQEFEEYKMDKAENDKISLEMYEQVVEKMNNYRYTIIISSRTGKVLITIKLRQMMYTVVDILPHYYF